MWVNVHGCATVTYHFTLTRVIMMIIPITCDNVCCNIYRDYLNIGMICFGFQSLTDSGNYHEFCRLLARLKSNYQLGELVKVDNYPEVIKLIAEFTITSLQVSMTDLTSFLIYGLLHICAHCVYSSHSHEFSKRFLLYFSAHSSKLRVDLTMWNILWITVIVILTRQNTVIKF
jgi:hypothetical protein